MLAEERLLFGSDSDLKAELEELRHELLPLVLAAVAGLATLWSLALVLRFGQILPEEAGIFVLFVVGGLGYALREKRYLLACWVLLAGMIATLSLLVLAHPTVLVLAFGVLVVIVANALLGTWAALAAGTVSYTHLTLPTIYSV
jgi:hypothetical protein